MAANTLVLQPGMVLTISFRWVAVASTETLLSAIDFNRLINDN